MYALPSVLTVADLTTELQHFKKAQGASTSTPSDSVLTIDGSSLENFDSGALAFLLEIQRWAQQQGRTIHFQGLPTRLLELATLYGVQELITTARPH